MLFAAGKTAGRAIWGEDLERTQDTSLDRLVDLIRENVDRDTWDKEGFSLAPSSGQIWMKSVIGSMVCQASSSRRPSMRGAFSMKMAVTSLAVGAGAGGAGWAKTGVIIAKLAAATIKRSARFIRFGIRSAFTGLSGLRIRGGEDTGCAFSCDSVI